MFSPDIVCSDEFLDMPVSSRDLYYQLGIRADDDGFVQPKSTMRLLGASDDDLKVLLAKRFLLKFESGVVVIKHWLIHNLIRADMYKETRYLEEKSQIGLKDNGSYTEIRDGVAALKKIEAPEWLKKRRGELCTVNVPQTAPRLGKVRLGKEEEPKGSVLQELSESLPNTALGEIPETTDTPPLAAKEEKRVLARLAGIVNHSFGSKAIRNVKYFCELYQEKYGKTYGSIVNVEPVARSLKALYGHGLEESDVNTMLEDYFGSEKANALPVKLTTAFSDDTYRSWSQGKMGTRNTKPLSL